MYDLITSLLDVLVMPITYSFHTSTTSHLTRTVFSRLLIHRHSLGTLVKLLHPRPMESKDRLLIMEVTMDVLDLDHTMVQADSLLAVIHHLITTGTGTTMLTKADHLVLTVPQEATHHLHRCLHAETSRRPRGDWEIVLVDSHLVWKAPLYLLHPVCLPNPPLRRWTRRWSAGTMVVGVAAIGGGIRGVGTLDRLHHLHLTQRKTQGPQQGRESVTMIWIWLQRSVIYSAPVRSTVFLKRLCSCGCVPFFEQGDVELFY